MQEQPLGTGDAVAPRGRALEGVDGDVLVLAGDTPLLDAELLARAARRRTAASGAAVTVLSFEPETRARTDGSSATRDGGSSAIVEARDATPEQLALREVNSSIYVFDAAKLWPALGGSSPRNAQGELYLTDAVAAARRRRAAVADASRSGPGRDRGRQHARRARGGRGRPARPDQRRAHARRGDDRRSRADVDRADVEIEPDASSTRSRSCAVGRASRAAPRSGRTPSWSTPRSGEA